MIARPIPDRDPLAVALDHDYGDDATLVANFLTVRYPSFRQSAAITLLRLALTLGDRRPIVDEAAVEVCTHAIIAVTVATPAGFDACATLAHLTCRAFARLRAADLRAYEQHALLAVAEAAAAVLYTPPAEFAQWLAEAEVG